MESLWILLVTKKERIKDFLSNRFRLPVFDLSNPVLENFLGHFRTKNLIILTATLAQLFCSQILQDKSIVLKDVCPTLKACVVTSEMLLKRQKTSRTTGNSNYQRVRRVRTRFNRFST
jgi:phenylacetate-CoA ligase